MEIIESKMTSLKSLSSHPIRTSSEVLFLCLLFLITLQLHYSNRCSSPQLHYFNILHYFKLLQYCDLLISSLLSWSYQLLVIMSYYNQPLLDDWARPRRYKNSTSQYKNGTSASQFQKWHTNFKNGASDLFTRGLG